MQSNQLTTDLRTQGKETFSSLQHRFPIAFTRGLGCRGALRSLPSMRHALPTAPDGPWRLDGVNEEEDAIELRYYAEELWVDYHLGFLEALVDYFGECAFILVKTMRNELRFRLIFK